MFIVLGVVLVGIVLLNVVVALREEPIEIKAKRIRPNHPNKYDMPKFKRKVLRKAKVKRKVKK